MELELKYLPLPVNRTNKRHFLKWADRNGWQPYDSLETWINLKQGRRLQSAIKLWMEYRVQALEEIEST